MSRTVRLGLFIVVTLLSLSAGVFLIGGRQFMFSSTYRLICRFENVAGLETGAQVRVGGTNQGTVVDIVLPESPDEKVTVLMDLEAGTRKILRKDSVASIKTEGLLGARFIEVSFGGSSAEQLEDGDEIASKAMLDMDDIVVKANGILDKAGAAVDHANRTMAHASAISARIDKGDGTVGALINDRKLYDDVQKAANDLMSTVDTIKGSRLFKTLFRGQKAQPPAQ